MNQLTYERILQYDKSRLSKAYERLKCEYRKINTKTNPVKHSFSLERNADCVIRSTNVMTAQTKNGIFTKVITIDDGIHETLEDIIYTANDMTIYRHSNLNITPIRCAMMACIACDLNYQINSETVVGFIGNGNINITTAMMLNILFGVKRIIIRGSEKARNKNLEHFKKAMMFNCIVDVDDTEDCRKINECEVVICCTSSCDKKDLISTKELSKPRLIIAQDSGYVLDESFRKETVCYTDFQEQIEEHYRDEFPYDKEIHELKTMKEDRTYLRKSVYLYGIALADAIIYEEVFLC